MWYHKISFKSEVKTIPKFKAKSLETRTKKLVHPKKGLKEFLRKLKVSKSIDKVETFIKSVQHKTKNLKPLHRLKTSLKAFEASE